MLGGSRLSEVCSDKVTSTQIFSHGSDSTDSDDFIQSHIDSFFPPVDSGEVIEEYRERRPDYRIDYVVDLVDDALDMLVAGFAYVRDLVQTLGEMIVEWGMRVIDAIGEAFSAVRDAVREVGELLSSLVNWVKDFVRNYIEPIFEEIKDYMDEYIEGVIASYEKALDEYEKTGSISEETAKEVFDSLMDDMFYIIFGLTTTLMAVFTVLEGVSLGAGSIAMIAVPLLVTLIIDIFGETVEEAELHGLPTEFDVEAIIEYAKSLVGMGEEGIAPGDYGEGTLWNAGSIIFGMFGVIAGAAALDYPNPFTWGTYSIICGFISLLFGFYSLVATGLAELITGTISLIYGTAGAILGFYTFRTGPTGTTRGFGAVSLLFTASSIAMGVKAYS